MAKARIEIFLFFPGAPKLYKWRLIDSAGFCRATSPDWEELPKKEAKEAALYAKHLMAEATVEEDE